MKNDKFLNKKKQRKNESEDEESLENSSNEVENMNKKIKATNTTSKSKNFLEKEKEDMIVGEDEVTLLVIILIIFSSIRKKDSILESLKEMFQLILENFGMTIVEIGSQERKEFLLQLIIGIK